MDRAGDMQAFVRAVEEGGFAAAARGLGLTPSGVSRRIGRLEDRLGVRLMNRTTRRLSLTEAGETYLHRAQAILAEIEATERATAESDARPRGLIRIGTTVAFGERLVAPLMPDFLGRYPDLRVELQMTDAIQDLVAERLDLALRVASMTDSSLIARKLAADEWTLVASPDYLARHGTPAHPRDLGGHNCLYWAGLDPGLGDWLFETAEGPYIHRARGNFGASGGPALYAAALAGLGIMRTARYLAGADLRSGRLVALLGDFLPPSGRSIFAVYSPGRHLSPRVRAFIDFMVEAMTPTPPWER